MNHIGYSFTFEGELVCRGERTNLDTATLLGLPRPHAYPRDESFTVWVPNYREHCDAALQEAIERARVVVEFHRDRRDTTWDEFIGALWHNRIKVFEWELV
jgi:hypothetical protein